MASVFCETLDETDHLCKNDSAINVLANIYGDNFIRSFIEEGLSPSQVVPSGVDIAPIILGGLGSVALLLALILFFCLIFTTLINSAQDGEIFGKGGKKAVIIFRLVFAMIMLVPTPSAYCLIQVLLMGVVLLSNAQTNKIYNEVVTASALSNISFGNNRNDLAPSTDVYDARSFGLAFFQQAYCANVLNQNYYPLRYSNPFGTNGQSVFGVPKVSSLYMPVMSAPTYMGNPVTSIITGDVKPNENYSQGSYKVLSIVDTQSLLAPQADSAVCGSMRVFETSKNVQSNSSSLSNRDAIGLTIEDQKQLSAEISRVSQMIAHDKKTNLLRLTADISDWMLRANIPYDVSSENYPDLIAQVDFNGLQEVIDKNVKESQESYSNILRNNNITEMTARLITALTAKGWTYAGGIKNRIISAQTEIAGSSSRPVISLSPPQLNLIDIKEPREKRIIASMSAMQAVVRKTLGSQGFTVSPTPELINSEMPNDIQEDSDTKGTINRIEQGYTSYLSSIKRSLVLMLMTGQYETGTPESLLSTNADADWLSPDRDVLMNIQRSGEFLSIVNSRLATELMGMKSGALLVYGATGWSDTVNKVAHSFLLLITDVLAPVLAKIIMYLSILSPYMAVIIPSLPYFFFLTGVVAWYIHILQAMAGLPFWTVMHMIPDRSFVGSQTQGYITVISLFLRPILTLTGLFFGYLLANPVLLFVTEGFFMMQDSLMTSDSIIPFNLYRLIAEFTLFFIWLIVYCTLILQVCYMIFGLAGTLPDTVLKWLGTGLSSGDWGETNAQKAIQAGASSSVQHNTMGNGGGGGGGAPKNSGKPNSPNSGGGGGVTNTRDGSSAPQTNSTNNLRSGVDDSKSATGGGFSSQDGGFSSQGGSGNQDQKVNDFKSLGGVVGANGQPLSNKDLASMNKSSVTNSRVSNIGIRSQMIRGGAIGGVVGAIKGMGSQGVTNAVTNFATNGGWKGNGVRGAISGYMGGIASSAKETASRTANLAGNMHIANNSGGNKNSGSTKEFVDAYSKLKRSK